MGRLLQRADLWHTCPSVQSLGPLPRSQGLWLTEVLARDNLAGSCRVPKMHTWDILKEISTSSESQTWPNVRITWTACPQHPQSKSLHSAMEI